MIYWGETLDEPYCCQGCAFEQNNIDELTQLRSQADLVLYDISDDDVCGNCGELLVPKSQGADHDSDR